MKSSKSKKNVIIYENLYPRKQIHTSRGQMRHLFRVIAESMHFSMNFCPGAPDGLVHGSPREGVSSCAFRVFTEVYGNQQQDCVLEIRRHHTQGCRMRVAQDYDQHQCRFQLLDYISLGAVELVFRIANIAFFFTSIWTR